MGFNSKKYSDDLDDLGYPHLYRKPPFLESLIHSTSRCQPPGEFVAFAPPNSSCPKGDPDGAGFLL
jgi:hypothetical protein